MTWFGLKSKERKGDHICDKCLPGFTCKLVRDSEEVYVYSRVPWLKRMFFALLGATLVCAPPMWNYFNSTLTADAAKSFYQFPAALAATALALGMAGVILALERERDSSFMSSITAMGVPSVLFGLSQAAQFLK